MNIKQWCSDRIQIRNFFKNRIRIPGLSLKTLPKECSTLNTFETWHENEMSQRLIHTNFQFSFQIDQFCEKKCSLIDVSATNTKFLLYNKTDQT